MALSLVTSGSADAYVGNAVTSSYLIKKLGYHNLQYSGDTEYSSDHSIGITKNNIVLAGIIKKALASISKKDSEAIKEYWFGLNIQPQITIKTAVSIGSVLLGALLLILLWAFSLTKTKNELKRSQHLLTEQAEKDHLTGLGNRRKFYQLLDSEIEESNSTSIPFALFFLDMDRFKDINNCLGHAVGDLMLIEVANRIRGCAADPDKVIRLGGDKFIIILSQISDRNMIEKTARNIQKCLNDPIIIDGNETNITTSIGITSFPNDAATRSQLVINGDQAMYHSKKQGRNCYTYYNHTMMIKAQLKNKTIGDLRSALKEDQFVLYYQPIIDLSDNRISKAEALIRWYHPERGIVPPDEFIPLAEEAGLINEIGEWVFKEAVSQTVKTQNNHDADFQMSINTSPLQYRKNGINVSNWTDHLTSFGLSGKHLVMEITEGILMESNLTVKNTLLKMRDLDYQVAIDDFGTGYSSLSYLKKFDIDYLKIDKSFVQNLSTDEDDVTLVQTIIVMAHKLGCKVIAEGIETEIQKDILIAAGCDFAQGYYFSRPLIAREFNELVSNWDSKPTLKKPPSTTKNLHIVKGLHD